MSSDIRGGAPLAARLKPYFDRGDGQGLLAALARLSCAQYRAAGAVMGERLMPPLPPEEFWRFFGLLAAGDGRAFLAALLRSARVRVERGECSPSDEGFARAAASFTDVDWQKTLQALLPAVRLWQDAELLLRLSRRAEPERAVPLLMAADTLPCAYALFRSLRYAEHDRVFLARVARQLAARGTSLGYNLASLARAYFALDEVGGTFSLRLEPFQLARLEASYGAFCQAMRF